MYTFLQPNYNVNHNVTKLQCKYNVNYNVNYNANYNVNYIGNCSGNYILPATNNLRLRFLQKSNYLCSKSTSGTNLHPGKQYWSRYSEGIRFLLI